MNDFLALDQALARVCTRVSSEPLVHRLVLHGADPVCARGYLWTPLGITCQVEPSRFLRTLLAAMLAAMLAEAGARWSHWCDPRTWHCYFRLVCEREDWEKLCLLLQAVDRLCSRRTRFAHPCTNPHAHASARLCRVILAVRDEPQENLAELHTFHEQGFPDPLLMEEMLRALPFCPRPDLCFPLSSELMTVATAPFGVTTAHLFPACAHARVETVSFCLLTKCVPLHLTELIASFAISRCDCCQKTF